MNKFIENIVGKIREQIDADLITDTNIEWSDCVEALEELAEHCQEWANQIRADHEKD